MPRVRVTNTTAHDIVLPPVNGAKRGGKDWGALRILPGGYNVDVEYLDAIRGEHATKGARRAYEKLTTPGDNGQAMLVITEGAKATAAKEGPTPPKSLKAYSESLAMQIVKDSTDIEALTMWQKDTRPAVSNLVRDRIAHLREGGK